ncbi:MAG: hypothetical protein RSB25_07435 [Acinetobacter sp.]
MKYAYIYSGLQAAFVFSGLVVLPTGVSTTVDEEVHQKLKDKKITKHLIDVGDLTITEVEETGTTKTTSSGKSKTAEEKAAAKAAAKAEADNAAALASVKEELTKLQVTFTDDETLEALQEKLATAKE